MKQHPIRISGDDDAWVFVNRTLVVDLGALHGREDGSFTLDASDGSAVAKAWNRYYDGTNYTPTQGTNLKLGLKLGKVYEVAMFQAERNGPGCHYGPRCGDGIVQSDYEQCDGGANCRQDCQWDFIF